MSSPFPISRIYPKISSFWVFSLRSLPSSCPISDKFLEIFGIRDHKALNPLVVVSILNRRLELDIVDLGLTGLDVGGVRIDRKGASQIPRGSSPEYTGLVGGIVGDWHFPTVAVVTAIAVPEVEEVGLCSEERVTEGVVSEHLVVQEVLVHLFHLAEVSFAVLFLLLYHLALDLGDGLFNAGDGS